MFHRKMLVPLLLLGSLTQLGFAGVRQQSDSMGTQPEFWVALLLVAIVVVILLWWALRNPPQAASHDEHAAAAHAPEPEAEAAVRAAPPEPEPEPAAEEAPPEPEPEPEPAAEEAPPEPEPEPAAAPSEPDDLKRIEGIGPKVSAALIEMGITTFAQVAEADPETLEANLKAAGVRIISGAPKTWPEQAALAAKGDWEGLEKLQDSLKGGRRS